MRSWIRLGFNAKVAKVSQRYAKVTENELSRVVIGCAMKVHSALGLGCWSLAYEACLEYELVKNGLLVEVQKPSASYLSGRQA